MVAPDYAGGLVLDCEQPLHDHRVKSFLRFRNLHILLNQFVDRLGLLGGRQSPHEVATCFFSPFLYSPCL